MSVVVFSFYLVQSINANAQTVHDDLADGVLLGDLDKLDPSKPPGENFDLLDWQLTLPIDTDKDDRADTIPEVALHKGFELKPLFYTADSGGMVFASPNYGAKTSKNTKYVRTELREMLRRGDRSIKTRGITKNNWVFSSSHFRNQQKAGGVDGSMEATLSANRVSVTGNDRMVGRVIIGQIHATHDEPIRLYYRKLPNNSKGSIYFAHEIGDDPDIYVEMVGTRSHKAENPEDGIELNEIFSYKISVVEHDLTVTLIRQGKPNITEVFDMSKSGYGKTSEWMFFKAGVYNQNNSGDKNDFVQATFYHLHNEHKGYEYE
jgi:hypothetical protein